VAKNSKTDQTNGSTSSAEAPVSSQNTDVTSAPKKRSKAAKTSPTKAASKKTGAKTRAKKSTATSPRRERKAYEPSDADIRLRAYFIAERRVQLALKGDPSLDWIEARQQLVEEVGRPRA